MKNVIITYSFIYNFRTYNLLPSSVFRRSDDGGGGSYSSWPILVHAKCIQNVTVVISFIFHVHLRCGVFFSLFPFLPCLLLGFSFFGHMDIDFLCRSVLIPCAAYLFACCASFVFLIFYSGGKCFNYNAVQIYVQIPPIHIANAMRFMP